ncbi:flagellar protein FlaG [Variovorax dokdonensis]|uniref:Flagellar protein FlaG n=1 Tax=Variovorax dokdonensis TaxID=344883 RepID=A0ABT7N4V6_9BURK|nr:flagellar protein FlaG [Variovorax dokdonensis]MDM0042969.1 flagellar protein FlaG [Variovorax dokdonensis]
MSIPAATNAGGDARVVHLPSARADEVNAQAAHAPGQAEARRASDAAKAAAPSALEEAVRNLNASLAERSVGVRFELDADADRMVVKVVDRNSGELIRQIPTEEVLRLAKVLGQSAGVLVSESA